MWKILRFVQVGVNIDAAAAAAVIVVEAIRQLFRLSLRRVTRAAIFSKHWGRKSPGGGLAKPSKAEHFLLKG